MTIAECKCTGPGWCERHQIEKTEYTYQLCRTLPAIRNMWDRGEGPGPERQTDEDIARIESRQVAMLAELRPIAKRLAAEIKQWQLLVTIGRYRDALRRWRDAGHPVRPSGEQRIITEEKCPGCKHYNRGSATCGRCRARGQLIAAIAYMATAHCPIGTW